MNQVISESEARKITGGRKPLVPVVYEEALKNLAECISIDDAKYWSDKADALAAWAKIYHDDKLSRQAKCLKLEAFRRIGILAAELRPRGSLTSPGTKSGRLGPISLLKENGFSHPQARVARDIACMPEEKFKSLLERQTPPSPSRASFEVRPGSTSSYARIAMFGGNSPASFRGFCRRYRSDELMRNLSRDEKKRVHEILVEIAEWVDGALRFLERPGDGNEGL